MKDTQDFRTQKIIQIGMFLLLCCVLSYAGKFIFTKVFDSRQALSLKYSQLQDRSKHVIQVAETKFEVEVVTKPDSLKQGLSGRDSIGSDGMLFVFPDLQHRTFWMKDMRFPLDIIWIAHSRVVAIHTNVPMPLPDTADHDLLIYHSGTQVQLVLEVPAGTVATQGIQVGSPVQLLR